MELAEQGALTKKLQFVEGYCAYKTESVAIHEDSCFHKEALAYVEERRTPIQESHADKAKVELQRDMTDKLDKLVRIVHTLTAHSRNLTDYQWQVSLMTAGPNGFDLGQQYINQSAANGFAIDLQRCFCSGSYA